MSGFFPVHDELAEETSDHLGFDLDLDEFLSVVDRHGLSDELGEDGEVPAVGPDDSLEFVCVQLVVDELLLVVQSAEVGPPGPGGQELEDSSKGIARSCSMLYPRNMNSFFLLAWIADAFFLDFLLEAFADPIIFFAIELTSS